MTERHPIIQQLLEAQLGALRAYEIEWGDDEMKARRRAAAVTLLRDLNQVNERHERLVAERSGWPPRPAEYWTEERVVEQTRFELSVHKMIPESERRGEAP